MAGLLSPPPMKTASRNERRIQVVPMGIVAFDEIDLPVALILLERFLALDRPEHALAMLVPDKPLQAVFLRELVDLTLAMLPDTPSEVACHADIKRAVLPVAQ